MILPTAASCLFHALPVHHNMGMLYLPNPSLPQVATHRCLLAYNCLPPEAAVEAHSHQVERTHISRSVRLG